MIFSICETAKENGLSPYEYLTFLFRALPNNSSNPIEDFLPGGCLVPESCLTHASKIEINKHISAENYDLNG